MFRGPNGFEDALNAALAMTLSVAYGQMNGGTSLIMYLLVFVKGERLAKE
jgi:hypothetical protein